MVDFFSQISYHNTNRTPRTSHASDVSHGETFFIRGTTCFSATRHRTIKTVAIPARVVYNKNRKADVIPLVRLTP